MGKTELAETIRKLYEIEARYWDELYRFQEAVEEEREVASKATVAGWSDGDVILRCDNGFMFIPDGYLRCVATNKNGNRCGNTYQTCPPNSGRIQDVDDVFTPAGHSWLRNQLCPVHDDGRRDADSPEWVFTPLNELGFNPPPRRR